MNFKHNSSEMDRVVWSVRSLVLMTVAFQLVATTVAAPAANLISSLPGQPPVPFKQYSGYITVDQSHGRKLFYYFAEAANSSARAPLIVWLNGGAFSELGPFYPNTTGDGLFLNNFGWNQEANVIFLESPAGVGFSYSKNTSDYRTGDNKTAQDSVAFLLGWLSEYPEYNLTDFYITGESYAGHYIPQFAAAILKNNNVPGQAQINLKGILAGNPLFDFAIDHYAQYEFAWGHGMIDEDTHDALLKYCNWTACPQSHPCLAARSVADAERQNLTYINDYDVLEDVCLTSSQQALVLKALFQGMDMTMPDPCVGQELNTYLNLHEVQSALHAEVTNWTQCGVDLTTYNYDDRYIPMAPVLADLVNSNLRVWIYSGDLDMVIPVIGTRQIINTLAKSLNLTMTSTYQPWYQGSQIGGWTVSWGSLVYSTVRGAGHMVPATQPARALQLVTSFLAGNQTPPLTPT